jgi:pimeloyl-ACP methyl ester carboxylesterase
MDRSSSFTRLMARLPDWHVVSYDRRGYAGSHHLPPDPDFSLQVDDLLEVLAGRPAVAFGHSLGGDVVLAAMATHPGCISRALVWEPPQPWLAWWPDRSMSRGRGSDLDPADRAELFMRSMVGDRIWERLPAATREQRRAEGPTLSADMASIGAGPVFDPAAITAPVLVGRGGRSRPHHRWAARELAASLPSGELVEIPDSDHGPHLSHPSDLAVLVTVAASRSAPQETQPPEARS